ncbi:MAG: N-acetylmuramoyl-L-alanine amidase [Chthoniobacterales bacterium]
MRSNFGTALALFGMLLMGASLIWLDSLPHIEHPAQPQTSGQRNPFPLVVLDAGHGGHDSGAMCAGMMEKDLTLDVAQRLERRLHEAGLSTVMTRPDDKYISLADRASLTNRIGNCILVSIHFNDADKTVSSGVETYYAEHQAAGRTLLASWLPFLQPVSSDGANLESQSLAGFIQDALVKRTHAVNRGTKTQQFYVLANVRHPAVLVEGGFISNKEDASKLGNAEYREQLADAVSDGILHYKEVLESEKP